MNKETIAFGRSQLHAAIPKVVTRLMRVYYFLAGNAAAYAAIATYFHYLTPEMAEKILGAIAVITPALGSISHYFGVVPTANNGAQPAGNTNNNEPTPEGNNN